MLQPSTLVTGVQTVPLNLLAQAVLAAAAAFYLIGVHRLAARGRRWPVKRVVAFLAGVAAIWVAVGSAVAAHDDSSVTVHIVQHIILMMIAPPLLLLGRPLVLAAQAARRRSQSRLARLLSGRYFAVLGSAPATWALYLGSMVLMLADRSVYAYLIAHPLVHDASHAWLLGTGLLYWEPLLEGRRVSHPARVMSVLANMPFEVLVGIWLRYQVEPVDRINTLADTQRAGEAFVVGATLVSTVWLAVIVWKWAAAALREERRASLKEPSQEWTTPWWIAPTDINGAAGGP